MAWTKVSCLEAETELQKGVCVGMGVAPGIRANAVAGVEQLVEGVLQGAKDGIAVGSGTNALGLEDAAIGMVGSLVGKSEGKALGDKEGITARGLSWTSCTDTCDCKDLNSYTHIPVYLYCLLEDKQTKKALEN